jgi:hypothetical protein
MNTATKPIKTPDWVLCLPEFIRAHREGYKITNRSFGHLPIVGHHFVRNFLAHGKEFDRAGLKHDRQKVTKNKRTFKEYWLLSDSIPLAIEILARYGLDEKGHPLPEVLEVVR